MRALKAAVIAMGILITGATAALIVLLVLKATAPHQAAPHQARVAATPKVAHPAPARVVPVTVLDEPAGSRILAMVRVANDLALALSGGGADRVVIVDPANGRVLSRIQITH